jgi:hypothetical protein
MSLSEVIFEVMTKYDASYESEIISLVFFLLININHRFKIPQGDCPIVRDSNSAC